MPGQWHTARMRIAGWCCGWRNFVLFPTPVLSEMKDLGSLPSLWKECPCDAALESKTHLPRFELAAICTSDLML